MEIWIFLGGKRNGGRFSSDAVPRWKDKRTRPVLLYFKRGSPMMMDREERNVRCETTMVVPRVCAYPGYATDPGRVELGLLYDSVNYLAPERIQRTASRRIAHAREKACGSRLEDQPDYRPAGG